MQLDLNTVLESETQASLAFPKIVGCYSVDSDRNYQPNLSQLRYMVHPCPTNVNFDLNKGRKHFQNKAPGVTREEKLNHVLEFIARNFHKLRQPERDRVLRYDFVCFRGLLTRVMVAPFERENWTVRATSLRGTVYLWAFEEERDFPDKEKFVHWGYKFENYMFAKAPDGKSEAAAPANANEEFCMMFSSRVNDTLVLYGAEVDGVDSDGLVEDLSGVKLVEVKTNRIISNQKNERTFLLKTLKWFCQSFLVGIDDIYVGFRTDGGIVKEVVRCAVNELPQKAAGLWDKKSCLKFLDAFLKFVLSVVGEKSEPHVTWLFDYDWRRGVVTVRRMEYSDEFSFLPQWYIEMINKA